MPSKEIMVAKSTKRTFGEIEWVESRGSGGHPHDQINGMAAAIAVGVAAPVVPSNTEHMPLWPRRSRMAGTRGSTGGCNGDLAQFDFLDAWQYRSPQIPGSTTADTLLRRDPTRTILGFEQEEWFIDGLSRPGPRWHIAPQGVLMDEKSSVFAECLSWHDYISIRKHSRAAQRGFL
jgi:hypothetical protein